MKHSLENVSNKWYNLCIMYIYRELLDKILTGFEQIRPHGIILSGIVGCGKTTLIEKLIEKLLEKNEFQILKFTGDDVQFRQAVASNSRFLLDSAQSQSTKHTLIFVDEVQKTEEVFDALKIAYDSKKISFIVSGSNPAYLSSIAKKRLQRRAIQIHMLPLSVSEILVTKNYIDKNWVNEFEKILFEYRHLNEINIPDITSDNELNLVLSMYMNFGGLPLSYLAQDEEHKMLQIRLTTERGFDLISTDNNMVSEKIKIELAELHSCEFTYQNILNKTRLRKRDIINKTIDELINHGYLVRKKPSLLSENKSSYLSVFSYVDPGIVTYLQGQKYTEQSSGFRIEGYVHSRLDNIVSNSMLKTELGYFKPHIIDSAGKTKYYPGEIDFIIQRGKRVIPIESKSTDKISQVEITLLKDFLIKRKDVPYAILLYGGVPFKDTKNKILFWPYWMI